MPHVEVVNRVVTMLMVITSSRAVVLQSVANIAALIEPVYDNIE